MTRRKPSQGPGSLVVVGVGINGAPQTTLEAVDAIKRADRVFYVVPDPVTKCWIESLNPVSATLDDLYVEGKNRRVTYAEMVDRLTASVIEGHRVCAVFYGHPGVLVNAAHWAVSRLRRKGYGARMTPGISAEACLFADLGVNPGDYGLQSYEANDFLASRRRIDPTSNLILWQVGVLGEPSVRKNMRGRPERLLRLATRLERHYPATHRLVLYEAPTFPASLPIVKRVALSQLPRCRVGAGATLYVPPIRQRPLDRSILRWFKDK
jgi:uroporphyrin-III C-methyltransferase